MNNFVLYNNATNQYLVHPDIGLWSTNDKKEAEEMLKVATDYINSFKCKYLENKIVMLEVPENFNYLEDPVPCQ